MKEADEPCMPDIIQSQVAQVFGFSILKSCVVKCIYFISASAWIRTVVAVNKCVLNCVNVLSGKTFCLQTLEAF